MQGYEGRPGTPGGCGLMGTSVSRHLFLNNIYSHLFFIIKEIFEVYWLIGGTPKKEFDEGLICSFILKEGAKKRILKMFAFVIW